MVCQVPHIICQGDAPLATSSTIGHIKQHGLPGARQSEDWNDAPRYRGYYVIVVVLSASDNRQRERVSEQHHHQQHDVTPRDVCTAP